MNIDFTKQIEESLQKIQTICENINSFDLIAYMSYYNSLYSIDNYTDYRDDKNFFISEAIAIQCLKNEYIDNKPITDENIFKELQEHTQKYCFLNSAIEEVNSPFENNTLDNISTKLVNEAKSIRNPGLPMHHLEFSKEIFTPLDKDLISLFGFSIDDSVKIRKNISSFLNNKLQEALKNKISEANELSNNIIKYKKGKITKDKINIKIKNLQEVIEDSSINIRKLCQSYFIADLYENFGPVYSFTAEELADFTEIEVIKVSSFLNLFSCLFQSVSSETEIYSTNSILKKRPIIKHDNRYIIPSIPLLTWALEDIIEEEFKKYKKTYAKYLLLKHDFTLNQSIQYFKTLLPNAIIGTNLFYAIGQDRFETDSLIFYENILFIIEAKGNRISDKSKSGHKLKTKDHLNDIVKNSYNQAIRTLEYITKNDKPKFLNNNKSEFKCNFNNIQDVIIISLAHEPLGNLSPIIKTTNNLFEFNDNYFPWIISIYDLKIIYDLFPTPSLLLHYIKMRKKLLQYPKIHLYEELDIIGHYLKNRLLIDKFLNNKENLSLDYILFAEETDLINNYYIQTYNNPSKFIKKPSPFPNEDFKNFITTLDKSDLPFKIDISCLLLNLSNNNVTDLMKKINTCKKRFKKDNQLHDTSLFTYNFGFTYMIAKNKEELSKKIHSFCLTKKNHYNAETWIAVGEINNKLVLSLKIQS